MFAPLVRSRLFAAAFFLTALVVMWLSLRPMIGGGGGHIDKVQHFLAYAALTVLGLAASRGARATAVVAGVVAFGAGVEVLQALLPTGRTGSVLDGLANTAGAGLAWVLWRMLEQGRRTKL